VTLKITVIWDITPFSPYKFFEVSAECAAIIFTQKFTNILEEISTRLHSVTPQNMAFWKMTF
jgi:hypothetical protein